ncbi:amidohydrolase [Congregibacter variabilis]|uniref:Amidohydrolase n=1 Tax=Congregibacter variabilis TaxID=3081200 RepID=A0ABZ0I583_9GAMM|nr:amidohydrolase [Congregibacter sp. IMCC43200]
MTNMRIGMKTRALAAAIVVALGVTVSGQITAKEEVRCPSSDLLLYSSTIYTADDSNWRAEAVAILDDRIVFVGSNEEAASWHCGAQETMNLKGSVIYPGFTDSHQHLEGVGKRTRTLNLFEISTRAATIERIKDWASSVPTGNWVLGRGWIEREWTDDQRFLNREDVDAFTANKPLYMPRADGVSALVNSKALDLAGVDASTPDPEGGRFERDEQGNPTGYVLARAMDRFRAILPPETDEYIKENLRRGMQANAARGWTQTHDAGMSLREAGLLRGLHESGEMAHRVYIAVPIAEAQSLIEHGAEQSSDGFFEMRGIKVFIDGTLGSRGAALIENYADAQHNGFMNRTTQAELMPVLEAALRGGFQVMTHVIGDRALRNTLDWYSSAWQNLPQKFWKTEDLRWRVEHAQIIPPVDQQRLFDMQIIPSMQPSHAIGDLNFAPARLGKERLSYAYPWQDLINRGLQIVAGSDAPVEAGDPRIEFYAAITRRRLDGSQGEEWHPEFAVSRSDALRMLTLWPAYAAFQEDRRGSIRVGNLADLTVFDTDFMQAAPADILTAKTVMTLVGGRISYAQNSR